MSQGLDRKAIEHLIQRFLTIEGLYLDQITLHHGAALVFHGFKEQAGDIDIEVPSDVFVRLREKYADGRIPLKFHQDLQFTHPAQFKPYLPLGCFEIFPEETGAVDVVDDYIVYTPEAILTAKLAMNREKDFLIIRHLRVQLEQYQT